MNAASVHVWASVNGMASLVALKQCDGHYTDCEILHSN